MATPTVSTAGLPADIPSLAGALFQWARKDSKLKVIPAVERELIIQALIETQGNQVQAAKILGITRATLRKRIDKFKIQQQLAIR
jgi:two-component system nitrogen regulation response regulator GlnG